VLDINNTHTHTNHATLTTNKKLKNSNFQTVGEVELRRPDISHGEENGIRQGAETCKYYNMPRMWRRRVANKK